jgi:oligopeptide transport system permease protein
VTTQADYFEAGKEPPIAEGARKGQSLWADSYRRLIQNRAAVIGGVLVILLVLMAIFAPLIAPKSFSEQVLTDNNKVPAWLLSVFPSMKGYVPVSNNYLLGADYVGRDLLSRIIYGARVSLSVAFVGPIISMLVGVTYGSISGYFGGRLDDLMMRIVDVMYAFPSLLFIILLMAFFRSTLVKPEPGSFSYMLSSIDTKMGGMFFIFIGIGVTAWQQMARLTRGQVLSVREKEYVEAAHAIGARNFRVMTRHILPNIVGPLVVAETLTIPSYILTEAFLSFIGLGVNPPTPSWGAMISDGSRVVRSYPNQALFPAIALAITMFAFNFLGDGLRDAFDPRLRGTR